MALKATIYKAQLQIADMDRNVYADHTVVIARHPSEADERMMIRLLAFALNVTADDNKGKLEFAKDLWDVDEAALWHKDFTDAILHGTPLLAPGIEGINGLTLVNAMYLSTWTDNWVDVPFDEHAFLAQLNARRAPRERSV